VGLAQFTPRQIGRFRCCQAVLATGLRNCPQSPGCIWRATRSVAVGKFDDAANEFMISDSSSSNEPDAYIELGNMLIVRAELRSVEQIRQALIAEPGNPAR